MNDGWREQVAARQDERGKWVQENCAPWAPEPMLGMHCHDFLAELVTLPCVKWCWEESEVIESLCEYCAKSRGGYSSQGKGAVLLHSCPSNTRSRVCIPQGVMYAGWERKCSPWKTMPGCAVKRGCTNACMCKDEGVGPHWALHWEQWNPAHLVPSHIQQVGCLNFSFSEKMTTKEIKWWLWEKLLGRKLGHLCKRDGDHSYQSTNTQPLVTQWCDIQSRIRQDKDLLWELAAGKATAAGKQGYRGNPDSKWQSPGDKSGNGRRTERLNPWNGLGNGCVWYHKGWAPQLALSCGSGRQCRLCCLQERCERTRREGGEGEIQVVARLGASRYQQEDVRR